MIMRADEIKNVIRDSLPENEQIEQFIPKAIADGKYMSIATTPLRVILCKRGMFKYSYEDFPWVTLKKVVLEEGVVKGTICFSKQDGSELRLRNIKKEHARQLCGYARTMIDNASLRKLRMGKTCPDCGELVKQMAKICPYCRHEFE
ncbi:MAG: PH domain-containing protein [candidate division Zixibacteria bacterium]|nr:PH domain-containing protein [candidate division Zixibacteria bacterium]